MNECVMILVLKTRQHQVCGALREVHVYMYGTIPYMYMYLILGTRHPAPPSSPPAEPYSK